MPFRDWEWEDFSRDCAVFPAYTDYIYGVDTRPEVVDEPGLHPQIYQPLAPHRLRIHGLPQTPHSSAHDVSRASPYSVAGSSQQRSRDYRESQAVTRELLQMFPNSPSTSLSKRESSMENRQATPTPAPSIALLRPGELAADPLYSFIPQHERSVANKNIIQAWSILRSDAIPAQRAKAMGYLKNMSRMAAAKKQEYWNLEAKRREVQEVELQRIAEFQGSAAHGDLYYNTAEGAETQQAGAEEGPEAEREPGPLPPTYAIHDISQLPAYVQGRLPQLWTCAEMVALRLVPTDEFQLRMHQQAQQYLVRIKHSVPPEGRPWLGLLVDEMLQLRRQGRDPYTVLETMPSVESVYEYGAERFRSA